MEEKDLNIILKDFIATYMNPSYGSDFDLVKSKFPELNNQDPQLLKDYIATYLNPKYQGDFQIVNSKFPELFQKKNLSGQGSQTGSEMSDTGSTLSQDFKVKDSEKETPSFIKDQVSLITKDLIGKTEEQVVPELNYRFGPLGFSFEETGFGNFLKVKSANGKTSRTISLSNFFEKGNEIESEALKSFIIDNMPDADYISRNRIDLDYSGENQKISSEKEIDGLYNSVSESYTKMASDLDNILPMKEQIEKESSFLSSATLNEKNSLEYSKRVDGYNQMIKTYNENYNDILSKRDSAKNKEKEISKAVSSYMSMKEDSGNFLSAALGSLFVKSTSNITMGYSDVLIDLLSSILPDKFLLGKNAYEEAFLETAKKEGINKPEGISFEEFSESLSKEDFEKVSSATKDIGKKRGKKEFFEGITSFSDDYIEKIGASPEYYNKISGEFVPGAVLGAIESVPAMITGVGAIPLMSAQVISGVNQEMMNNPEFDDITENEKLLIKAPIAIVSGILERFGFSNLIKNKSFLTNMTQKMLGKMGSKFSSKTFAEFVAEEVDNMIARGALTMAGGFASEFETGFLQESFETGIKGIYNTVKEKEMFDVPDNLMEFVSDSFLAGVQEGIGAIVLGGPTAVSSAFQKRGYLEMSNDDFLMFELAALDDNIARSYEAKVMARVTSGEITKKEFQKEMDSFNASKNIYFSIPEGLSIRDKKIAMNLIQERSQIERSINGKDPSMVKPQKKRIEEINNRLEVISLLESVSKQKVSDTKAPEDSTKDPESSAKIPESSAVSEEGPSYKIDGATMDKPRFVEAINEAAKEDSLNELETNDPEIQKLIDQKRSEITGIPTTESVDAELNQEVEQLRAQEQAELAEALTDPEQYMVDGVIDGDKITNPAEKKIFDDIYKKYDERIAPLLEASKTTLEASKESVKEYVEELNKTKGSDPETYWSVDEVSPDAASEGTIIKDEDGYGVVGKDGDVKGVFKKLGSKAKGVAQKILKKAVEAGGIKLDNFDTYLTDVYKKAGFRVVSRTKFNEEFAPEGWSKEKHGTPDVVAMVYDPDSRLNIEEKLFDNPETGYDEMIKYRDSFVEQAKSLYPIAEKSSAQTKVSEIKKPKVAEKKTETDKKDAIIQSIKKAGKTLKIAFPDVKFVVGKNAVETRAKIIEELTPILGAAKAKRIASQFYSANGQATFVDGKAVVVAIDQEKATLSTAPHEVWHVILREAFGKSPKKFEEFRNGVANSLINNGFENIAGFLDDFSSLYDGNITYEEYLAELGGQLVAQRVDPSKFSPKEKSFIQEFKDLVNKIARDVIGKDVFLKDATPENILDFMISVSSVMAEGGDVRKLIGKPKDGGSKGDVDIVKQSTEAFSGKLTEMGISIGVTNPKTGKVKVTNFDVAKGLNEYYTEKYGTIPPGDFSQKAIDALADYASTEMLFAMAKFGDNSGKGWYTEDYSKALGVLSSIDPDINKDPKIKAITTSIIAVASNSSGVYDNLTRVIYGISEYKKTGKIPLNVGTGKGQEAIATGIDRYNKVIEKLGNDPVRVEKFMSQIGKVSDLKKKLVKEFDMNSWAEAKKEFATDPDWNDSETLPMSVLIFGPKIGAFWSNLSGLDGTPTIDRWCIRTIYRYKGDMRAKIPSSVMKSFMLENGIEGAYDSDAISLAKEHSKIFKRILTGKGEYSSLTKPERNELLKPYRKGDQIWSKAQGVVNDISEGIDDSVDNKAKYGRDFRTFTKNVFEKARDIVFDQTGIKLSVSDVQAILWIYEKNLFGQLGVRQREDSTYSSAANSIVNKVKSGSLTVDMLKSGDLKALETDKISSDGPMGDTYTFEDKQFKNGLDSREKRSKESIEISKQESISGDVEITSQKELPSRVNQEINNIISEQRALDKKPAEISKEAIKYLKGTDAFAKLNDRLKGRVISGVKRLSGMRVKVTVDEYASLKDQIKLEARAAREVNFSNKTAIRQLSSVVKDMVSKGKISTFKASVIIRRIARTNFIDQNSVNSTISYIADVFDNANLAMKISRASSLIKTARKNVKSKLGQNIDLYTAVKSLLSVETSLIPTPMIDEYLSILEIVGERAKVLSIKDVGDVVAKINVILNSVKDKPPVSESQSKKETVKESVEASESLIKDILSSPLNVSKVSDQNDSVIARFLASINIKDLRGLLKTNSDGTVNRVDIKTLAAVRSNIEAGLVTHQAIILAEKIDKNRRVAKLDGVVSRISNKKLTVGVSRFLGKVKGLVTGKSGILETIRSSPLEFIDDIVGNYNDRTIRNTIFGKLASQKGKLDGRIADLSAKADAAESLFNKGRTDNNAVKAKYKVMAYLIQKEHDSNPDNPGVAPAIDFINETIKAIRKNESSLSSHDSRILESIAKEFSTKSADGKIGLDSDKILLSLSKNDMKAMRLIEDINSSTANEALFTSAVVRGDRVNIISNYIHHAVTSSDASTQSQALVDKLLNRAPGGRVSTKAGTLNDRTPGAKPIAFDPVYAAVKGAKTTLTDFYMTSEIRTAMSTMKDLRESYSEKGPDQSNSLDVINALYSALEESLQVTFQSHFHEDTSMESVVKKAQKLGYFTALASIPRAGAEFLSNVSYAVLSDPATTISATRFVDAAYSTDFLGFLTKIGSSETIRLASTEMLSGKYSEGSSLSGYLSGGRSKSKNKVLDYMSFISKYSTGGIQNISSAVSEALISTPDKAISKPYYIASFVKHFKKETGLEISSSDVKSISEGTSEYLSPEFEKQMESARTKADQEIVRLAASNNSFTTILKNAPRTSDSAMVSAYRAANSFMSRFYLTEYATVRAAVVALRKTGDISKAQAVGIISASATRMSSYLIFYSLLSSAFDSLLSSMFGLPEEEEDEEDLITKTTRSFAGQAVQMMTRRSLGNIGYIPVALAVENLNKEYGEDFGLREGDYDPYKSSLVYAQVTEKDLQTKSPYEIAAKVALGPYGPVASSIARFTVQTGRKMSSDSDKKILDAALESMDERTALEAAGNLGLLPFYKDIRRIMMSSMYAKSNLEKNKSYIYSKDFIETMESIDPEAAKEMRKKEKEMKDIFDQATGVQSSKKTKKDSDLEIEEIIKKYYNK